MNNNLWSPWRSQYVTKNDSQEDSCFLCECASAMPSLENLVVGAFEHTMVVMNKFPYNAGHLLVAPKDHVAGLIEIPKLIAHELIEVVQLSLQVCATVMNPHASNVGANLGRAAGAGVPDHLHIHIVPRWNGDTNFMPTVAQTKVVSSSLDELWQQFRHEFQACGAE